MSAAADSTVAAASASARYATFRVLLDEPAETPLLGFRAYARAFADTIQHSRPQFAIGIFGSWGSGKTTLMRAIERELQKRPGVVTVWFNAWRYEREEHLIVPLLDTLRDELERRAASRKGTKNARESARRTALTIGRTARAISRGLKFRVGVPLTGIGVDADLKAIEDAFAEDAPIGPSSFYHRSFTELERAMKEFVAEGAERIVVFIDDLDRCLPQNALTVLESMKLFFDLEGFVFVVGLDQEVIQLAVESKYAGGEQVIVVRQEDGSPTAREEAEGDGLRPRPREQEPGPPGDRTSPVSGGEYVKKIFQVPFALPRIPTTQLTRFFGELLRTSGLPEEQERHLNQTVGPHLRFLSGNEAVNPREVKRLINAYTLQMKLLSARGVSALRPDAVLALLTMSFRTEWRRLYDLLVADPAFFVGELKSALADDDAIVSLWPAAQPVPPDLVSYLRTVGRPLLDVRNLDAYVSSVEATRTSKLELGPAQSLVVELGRRTAALAHTEGRDPKELAAIASAEERL